jgi:hypothetical protein
MFLTLFTHSFVSCQICDNSSPPSWYLGSYIINTLPATRAMANDCLSSAKPNNLRTWVCTFNNVIVSLAFFSEINKLPLDPVNSTTWLSFLYYSLSIIPTWAQGTPSRKRLNVLAHPLLMKVCLLSSMPNLQLVNYPMNVVR